jgi:glycosyltransferase involved in cell wall biosynthesis
VRWIALVESCDHVCCRYRLRPFVPLLADAGHTLDLVPLPRPWWARLALFRRLRGAQVILQRRLLPGWQLALLRCTARHLVFDFDDAVFLRDSYARRGLHDPRRLRRFAATVRACDAVVAGNRFLRDSAVRVAPRATVTVIPTCVEPADYPPLGQRRSRDVLLLVWVGSSSTLQGLQQARPLLEEVGRRVPGVALKVICDRFLELDALPVQPVRWKEETEKAEIADADVGISWVPDDLWSRGKCGLKVLQYMAAGLPVVANPVGVHTEMIAPGQTGFLARTPQEWVEAIRRLAGDPLLRQRMGQAGRRRLEAEYSIAVGAARWRELLGRRIGADRLASTG